MAYNSAAAQVIKEHVKKTYANINFREDWRNLPEIPTGEEILQDVTWQDMNAPEEPLDYQKAPEFDPRLPHNKLDGSWSSKEEYLGFHYQILREDVVAPLRQSVAMFKQDVDMDDTEDTCVYTDVHFVGLFFAFLGPAFRIEFSTDRARKQIRWQQSSRLTPGSLVALSTSTDLFRSICKVGIVAARPIEGGLDRNPPTIDIFWGDVEDATLNPTESYVMIQSRLGLFEAQRHILVALQKLATENSPYFQKYLVEMNKDITAPNTLKERSHLDLRSIARLDPDEPLTRDEDDELCSYDVLDKFPSLPKSGMDESQLAACERMLTKSLAIVQGPPGTGKTFTSVQALKAILNNTRTWDSPIIIAAQTNHALDQLLVHISNFELKFARLGSRYDKSKRVIAERTLYELRVGAKDEGGRVHDCGVGRAHKLHDALVYNILELLKPITEYELLPAKILLEAGVMSQHHYDSFFEAGWSSSVNADDEDYDPLVSFRMPRAPVVDTSLEIEDPDQEVEELQESELEGQAKDDMEGLHGTWKAFKRGLTGRVAPGRRSTGKRDPRKILANNESLFDIPEDSRGAIYRHWETIYYAQLSQRLIVKLREYQESTEKLKMCKWERDTRLVNRLGIKVIGCTTTGLSKYRGLLAALNPSVLLIEEAAETLEANVAASIVPTIDQLILVGDHRQLQATTTLSQFEGHPYYMAISLFEKLVNNGIEYTMLNKQRRMIPEIRELLCLEPNPFYSDLHDHPSVLDRTVNRPPIPGMGGVDVFFFRHKWPERKDVNKSCYNQSEAEMIAGFFNYLVINGIDPTKITVLTFYNGQRKLLLKELNKRVTSCATTFKVFTVDAYQGEENEVILLSLVRSNAFNNRGLYFFGDALTICGEEGQPGNEREREALWLPILTHLMDEGKYASHFPLVCTNHNYLTHVAEPEHWADLSGGCHTQCGGTLACGHPCPHKCHPIDHDRLVCTEPCSKKLSCGHNCSGHCGQPCRCDECRQALARLEELRVDDQPKPMNREGLEYFLSTYATAPESPPKTRRSSPSKGDKEKGHAAWKNFDAIQADKAIDQARVERESKTRVKPEDIVFKETYYRVDNIDGKRVRDSAGGIRQTIPRIAMTAETMAEVITTSASNLVDEQLISIDENSHSEPVVEPSPRFTPVPPLQLTDHELDFLEKF
ncbi:DEAD box helicase protein [Rutstroemia sp. NJR-2017a BBW]|nr:DEAD box helicase protein [Rutstroemia sp. NJR-2017a BBW]